MGTHLPAEPPAALQGAGYLGVEVWALRSPNPTFPTRPPSAPGDGRALRQAGEPRGAAGLPFPAGLLPSSQPWAHPLAPGSWTPRPCPQHPTGLPTCISHRFCGDPLGQPQRPQLARGAHRGTHLPQRRQLPVSPSESRPDRLPARHLTLESKCAHRKTTDPTRARDPGWLTPADQPPGWHKPQQSLILKKQNPKAHQAKPLCFGAERIQQPPTAPPPQAPRAPGARPPQQANLSGEIPPLPPDKHSEP